MSIDNAEKRKSAASVVNVWQIMGITNNINKDAQWRFQVGWSYSGIIPEGFAMGSKWKASVARRKKMARRN